MKHLVFLASFIFVTSVFAGGGGDGEDYEDGGSYYSKTIVGKCTGKTTVTFAIERRSGVTSYVIEVIANKRIHEFVNDDYYMGDAFDGAEIFVNKNYLEGSKLTDYSIGYYYYNGDGSYSKKTASITTDIQFDGSKGKVVAWLWSADAPDNKGEKLVDVNVENCFH